MFLLPSLRPALIQNPKTYVVHPKCIQASRNIKDQTEFHAIHLETIPSPEYRFCAYGGASISTSCQVRDGSFQHVGTLPQTSSPRLEPSSQNPIEDHPCNAELRIWPQRRHRGISTGAVLGPRTNLRSLREFFKKRALAKTQPTGNA